MRLCPLDQTLSIIERCNGVMHRAGTNYDDQPIIIAVQNIDNFLARAVD